MNIDDSPTFILLTRSIWDKSIIVDAGLHWNDDWASRKRVSSFVKSSANRDIYVC